MSPLLSVILPVYNREAFVADAVQSILDQTYKFFELIIIDDASTDSTLEVVRGFQDQRIRILKNNENLGVSASRNKGIRDANGEFVAFMDSDDISAPQRLWVQLDLFNRRPEIDICGSWVKFLDSDKTIQHQEEHEKILPQLLLNCSLSLGSVMYRRKNSQDLLLNEDLQFGEDYELWSRVCWSWKMYNIQEPLLFYRIHYGQISRINKRDQLVLDAEIRLTLLKKIAYSQDSFPDEIIKRILLFKEYFRPGEFNMFLKWLKSLARLNFQKKVFPQQELEKVLQIMRQELLFKIYFTTSEAGIGKFWRMRTLMMLDKKEVMLVVRKKLREHYKRYLR